MNSPALAPANEESQMPQPIHHPLYANMKFAPYEYTEYPKHIPLASPDPETKLDYIVVHSEREEAEKAPEILQARKDLEKAQAKLDEDKKTQLKQQLVKELLPDMKEQLRKEILAEMQAEAEKAATKEAGEKKLAETAKGATKAETRPETGPAKAA